MKVIITENRLHSSIEKYILDGYPMVRRVRFTPGGTDYIINIDFIDGKMTHSPSYMGRRIRNDINSMFGFDIDKYGSDWGMEVKMVRN
jgi:hypothetical protein